jgi:hypothetical protein
VSRTDSRAPAEVAFVLACVREPSTSEPSRLADAAANVRDWNEVLRLAESNRVTAFVLRAVNCGEIHVPPETMRTLADSVAGSVARRMVVDMDLTLAAGSLREASIRVMALKGPGLARTVYAEPSLRPYDDVDLSVVRRDIDKVAAVLEGAGFAEIPPSRKSAATSRDFVSNATRTLIELHCDLLQIGLQPRCDPDRWHRASEIPGLTGPEMLAPEDQVVHLSFHAHKHGFTRLIWLKDIDMVVRAAGADLDWDLIVSVSRREELRPSVWLALNFARALLGTPVPLAALRSLKPAAPTRLLYGLVWPPASVHALRGRTRRRAVQFDASESWRGMIPSVVFMGRRLERVGLFARELTTGAGAS